MGQALGLNSALDAKRTFLTFRKRTTKSVGPDCSAPLTSFTHFKNESAFMSDDVLIRTILSKRKLHYGINLPDGEAFEYFCGETVLKRFGLTFDEIDKGVVDGQNDGGIDSVYFFVNRSLIAIDTEMNIFKSPVEIDLYIIQSKMDSGFTETAISKLITSVPELIKLGSDATELAKLYNSDICEVFEKYRESIIELATQFPTVKVHIIYSTLALSGNSKADAIISILTKVVEGCHSKSECTVELWDAARLYQEAQKQSVMVKKLPFVKQPISHGNGYIILTKLEDYFAFIDDGGQIIDALFEFNVRDYQSGASVNKDIAITLALDSDAADFWWLNNGVTILAEEAAAQDNKLTVRNPIVVNGLQTSHEIHRYFAKGGKDNADRSVQVRVLQINDEDRRDRVIKATNSQTSIKSSSLHATEPFQRKIEDYLLQLGIFYDRRKDYWRNKCKPVDKIIGIDKLAQSVIAILLMQPHNARGRPTTIMKEENVYREIFSDRIDLKIYDVCTNIYFAVDKYFREERASIPAIYRNNLRYHVMMQVAWRLNGSWPVHPAALRGLKLAALKNLDIKKILDHTIKRFDEFGAEDRFAKSEPFTIDLQQNALVKASALANAGAISAAPAAV
jgi:hypothetical protein